MFLVRAAAHAHCTSSGFSQAPPCLTRVERFAAGLVHPRHQAGPAQQMPGGRKTAHVEADLGDDRRRGAPLHAGNPADVLDDLKKGGEQRVHLPLEARDPLGEMVDQHQMLAHEERVVAREAAVQRRRQFVGRGLEPPVGERREPDGIGLAGDQRRQNASAVGAEQIGDHRGELDVGILQHLADAVLASRTIWRCNCRRVRVRSRKARIGSGGTKLARARPCASRSESQRASLASLLRPGMLRTSCALASCSANDGSRICQTGFQ